MFAERPQIDSKRRKIKRVYGGVTLPIVPSYALWADPAYGYFGGMMSIATDGEGQPSSADMSSMAGGVSQ